MESKKMMLMNLFAGSNRNPYIEKGIVNTVGEREDVIH